MFRGFFTYLFLVREGLIHGGGGGRGEYNRKQYFVYITSGAYEREGLYAGGGGGGV